MELQRRKHTTYTQTYQIQNSAATSISTQTLESSKEGDELVESEDVRL